MTYTSTHRCGSGTAGFTQQALAADALSLGPHWVYSQSKLAALYPDGVRAPTDPQSQYHPNRQSGQSTHYGDQTRWLSETIGRVGHFDADSWRETWLAEMVDYDGYVDGSMTETLAQAGKAPSRSNDIAGAARMAPILDLGLPLAETLIAVRQQTKLTHGDPVVADAGEFIVRAVFSIRAGTSFVDAFRISEQEGDYAALDARGEVRRAIEAETHSPYDTAREFGLTCHTPDAFPLILYLALLHEHDAEEALSCNSLCGGDNAARALLLAVLFAAQESSEFLTTPSIQKVKQDDD